MRRKRRKANLQFIKYVLQKFHVHGRNPDPLHFRDKDEESTRKTRTDRVNQVTNSFQIVGEFLHTVVNKYI